MSGYHVHICDACGAEARTYSDRECNGLPSRRRAMIFLRNDDGSISVDGGEFAQEADFDVYLLRGAGSLLETTIRLTTREGTAVYKVTGSQPLVGPTLHARLVRVEGAGE